MPDLFATAALWSFLMALGVALVGLLVLYLVIFAAVRTALRSHARWMHEGGPETEAQARLARATR